MAYLGQDFPFGFLDIPAGERLRAVRAAGFDEVMIHWQEENGKSAPERYDQAIAAGLRVRTVHFPQEAMADLWREGEAGNRLEEHLIRAIRETGERGIENLVTHTTRRLETPPPNETGLRRMARAAEAAEKAGVNIALENTRFLQYNQFLFDHLDSPRLTFCYDCGHAHCFTPGYDPLSLFGSRMTAMHLHDNHGIQDQDEHLLIGDGNIDLSLLFSRLAAFQPVSYSLESRYRGNEMGLEEYLAVAHGRLKYYVDRAERMLSRAAAR